MAQCEWWFVTRWMVARGVILAVDSGLINLFSLLHSVVLPHSSELCDFYGVPAHLLKL